MSSVKNLSADGYCHKNPKTLSGIETCLQLSLQKSSLLRHKNPKTLSGIETEMLLMRCDIRQLRAKTPKPYQGLKRIL